MKPIFAMALLALPAFAAFPNGYSYCKVVTTSATMVSGTSDLVNYPLTVILTDNDLRTVGNSGFVNDANGYDIGFYPDCSGSGAALQWEMEFYSPTTGAIVAHVLRPTLSHTVNDTIGMYYGGSFSSFQSTASAVWDASYKGVWHLPNGTTLTTNDSTSFGHNGTASNATAIGAILDGGATLNGASSYLNYPSTTDFDAPVGTWECWARRNGAVTSGMTILSRTDSNGQNGLTVDFFTNSGGSIGSQGKYTGTAFTLQSSTISQGVWYHIVVTYNMANGGANTLYVNGASVSSANASAAWSFNSQAVRVGKSPDAYWDNPNISVDDIRISNIARSADWILTEYRNQSAPGTYISAGPRSTGFRVRHRVIGGI